MDATVVTNELYQIQNYVSPTAWVVLTAVDHGFVEDVTDGSSEPTNMDN